MPVSGVPDPEEHWHCVSCEQWFEADEGSLFERQRFSQAGQVADALRGGPKLLFRCDPCARKHSRNRFLFWVIAGGLGAIALAWQLWQERR